MCEQSLGLINRFKLEIHLFLIFVESFDDFRIHRFGRGTNCSITPFNDNFTITLVFSKFETGNDMFEIQEKFGQLVDQWRFMDATFAPRIEFRDEANFWVRRYNSPFIGMLPILRGVINVRA